MPLPDPWRKSIWFRTLSSLVLPVLLLASLPGCGGGGGGGSSKTPLTTLAGIWKSSSGNSYVLISDSAGSDISGSFPGRFLTQLSSAQGTGKLFQFSGSFSLSGTTVGATGTFFFPYQALPAPYQDYTSRHAAGSGTADSSGMTFTLSGNLLPGRPFSAGGTVTRSPASDLDVDLTRLPGAYTASAADTSSGQEMNIIVVEGTGGKFTFTDAAGVLSGTLKQNGSGNDFDATAFFTENVPNLTPTSQEFSGKAFLLPKPGSSRYSIYFMVSNADSLPVGLTAIFN